MPRVGLHLKELRNRRKLTVRELALRSGISHATISLIERDRTSPSIDTLSAMVDALGTTLVGFFDDIEHSVPYSPFYGNDDLIEIGDTEAVSYRMLGINHPNRHLLMLHETYEVGADTGVAFAHRAQEAGYVLRGEIELTLGAETQILRVGEGYYFDSMKPQKWLRLFEQHSPIYKWKTLCGLPTVQSCPRRRASLATNARRGGQLGAHQGFASYAASFNCGRLAKYISSGVNRSRLE